MRATARRHRAGAGRRRPAATAPPRCPRPQHSSDTARLLPRHRAAGNRAASDPIRRDSRRSRGTPGTRPRAALCAPPHRRAMPHSDLYAENVLFTTSGQPVFIDPHPKIGSPAFDWAFWCVCCRPDGGFAARVALCRSRIPDPGSGFSRHPNRDAFFAAPGSMSHGRENGADGGPVPCRPCNLCSHRRRPLVVPYYALPGSNRSLSCPVWTRTRSPLP